MRWLLALSVCVLGVGCQSAAPSKFVTQDQLRELLAVPEVGDVAAPTERQRAEVDRMVLASFEMPEVPKEAVKGAAALAVADRRLAPLAKALAGIDRAVEVSATNLANAETTAYKATRVTSDPDGGVMFRFDFEQGSLENTSRPLDVAISGQGLFKIKISDSISDGFGYTRNGNFFVNKDGELVLGMGDGYRLEPRITIPKGVTDVSIDEDGRIGVMQAGHNQKVMVGQIQVCHFMNPGGLGLLRGSIFTETDLSGPPIADRAGEGGAGQVLQGFLEGSNVDTTRERLRIRFLENWRNTILKAVEEAK